MNFEEIKRKYPMESNTTRCKDLSKQKFGKLVPLYIVDRKLWIQEGERKRTTWVCKCECGNICLVPTYELTRKHTQSCGCLREKYRKEIAGKKLGETNQKELLPGQKFGYLTVLKKTKTSKHGYYYLCKCECGNEIEVLRYSLTNGKTRSCGCIKSKGELKITKILLNNNIIFEKEKTFEDLRDKRKLRFDFYIPQLNRLIEYDGIQHYKETNGVFNKISLKERIRKDKMKNSYALSNNIALVRIPYYELDNINLDMLLGEKYLVRKED